MQGAPPEATYSFKHALVRDAAYESLLKSRRQELHARVAAVLEADYPEVTVRQPELIAHHLSEARLPERAIHYWRLAADDAARRQAHQEAIAHCTRGLAMLHAIPDQTQRDRCELNLQVRLGGSTVTAKGYYADEIGTAFHRALDLQARIGGDHLLHPILMGLYYFHAKKPDLHQAEEIGRELLALGEARNDRLLRVDGHKALLNACYKRGKFEEARVHLEQGMNLYGESAWPEVSSEYIDDPGPHLLIIGACVLWVLGYPDQARRAASDAICAGSQAWAPAKPSSRRLHVRPSSRADGQLGGSSKGQQRNTRPHVGLGYFRVDKPGRLSRAARRSGSLQRRGTDGV